MRSRRAPSRSFAAAAIVVAACGGSSSSGSVTPDKAVADAASAYCARINACAPGFVQIDWGDAATCSSRLKTQLAGTLAAPGTSSTPAQLESCAQALASATCDSVLGRNLPDACKAKPGSLADGAGCGDDAQCSGGHCKVPSGQLCGVCTALVAAGASCTSDTDCAYGLACAGSSARVCTAYAAGGATCDASHPCLATLACKSGTCATPDAAGAACDTAGNDACDHLHGIFCSTQTKTCQAIAFAQAGGACGLVGSTLTVCQASSGSFDSECKGLSSTSSTGTCQPAATDGAACGAAGPFCMSPSLCVNGLCKIDDPSTCR